MMARSAAQTAFCADLSRLCSIYPFCFILFSEPPNPTTPLRARGAIRHASLHGPSAASRAPSPVPARCAARAAASAAPLVWHAQLQTRTPAGQGSVMGKGRGGSEKQKNETKRKDTNYVDHNPKFSTQNRGVPPHPRGPPKSRNFEKSFVNLFLSLCVVVLY